ncbi:MAG: inorganic diphosphatase [Candidatus Kapabacteria bacterium]|nr:inorganic diphosphatase [Candidatus Kapabacteria bacterium]
MKLVISFLVLVLVLIGCDIKNRYNDMSAYSVKNKNLQMIIEVSSGSNKYFEYDYDSNVFKIKKINGKDELVKFLPCPVNVGFIPSTSRDVSRSKKMPIDVILISEALTTSTMVEIQVLGVMKLIEEGKERNYILAEPLAKELKILNINNFNNFSTNHLNELDIIQKWFLNYKPELKSKFVSWGNETEALNLIKNSIVN